MPSVIQCSRYDVRIVRLYMPNSVYVLPNIRIDRVYC